MALKSSLTIYTKEKMHILYNHTILFLSTSYRETHICAQRFIVLTATLFVIARGRNPKCPSTGDMDKL